jgi:pimeloyl-ACP methyl ester carboxylesterase
VTLISRVLAIAGLVLSGWALVTESGAVIHGHPAYAILLAITVAGSIFILWHNRDGGPSRGPVRFVAAIVVRVLMVGWLFAIWWLRPFTAEEPALSAMQSDQAVTVTESIASIVMQPADPESTGVVFQPGAKVEARAYAAVLRPLAEAGFPVVLVKQPLGIGFLALGGFSDAREALPEVDRWVVGGHSLGGTVASIEADQHDEDATAPAAGLLLFASYPGSDISSSLDATVLSLSGTRDALATPADIRESRADLPKGARFVAIEGAAHSQFGDYGPQPGDGQPTISHDAARSRISKESVTFVTGLNTR